MRRREAGPGRVGREEPAHLGLVGDRLRVARRQAPDELQVAEVAGGDDVHAPEPVQREHLDRPRPDLGDREQPREVGRLPAPRLPSPRRRAQPSGRRHLARGAAHRQRALGGQAAGLELGGRAVGDRRRRRRVAQAPWRRPKRAIMRRWIAIARGMSISCSVIDHISVSHGSGLRRTRSHGRARTARPITGSSREALVELRQVVVDARSRSASARSPRARPPPTPRAPRTRCRTRRPRPARRRRAAAARARRRAGASARPATAARAGTSSAAARPRGRGRSRSVNSRRSRWTSIRNEFDDTISPSGPDFLRFLAACWVRRRETTATVAAPATKPVAASAAACLAGTTTRRGGPLLDDAALRDHGEAVDDLRLLDLLRRRQPRSTDTTALGGRAWCRTRDPSTER